MTLKTDSYRLAQRRERGATLVTLLADADFGKSNSRRMLEGQVDANGNPASEEFVDDSERRDASVELVGIQAEIAFADAQ